MKRLIAAVALGSVALSASGLEIGKPFEQLDLDRALPNIEFASVEEYVAGKTSAIAETLGEHPAVIVAREWSTRGIDPNTFIVLHPAARQFLAAAPGEKDKVVAASKHGAPQAR